MPGLEFGGRKKYYGKIEEIGETEDAKFAIIDLKPAYDIPELELARRRFMFTPSTGEVVLEDDFAFTGAGLPIEEALVTWFPVRVADQGIEIYGSQAKLKVEVLEPSGVLITAEDKSDECRANQRTGQLTRLAIQLPPETTHFRLKITPLERRE
jgi:hypothetical protein